MITAESTPDYDEWGIDSYWDPQDWISYHKALKQKYGATEANLKFLKAWHKDNGFGGNFGASRFDYPTFDSNFRDYARTNGLYDGLFDASIIGKLAKVVSSGVGAVDTSTGVIDDTVDKTGEAVKDTTSAALNITTVVKWVVPIALVIALGIVLYFGYQFLMNKAK